MIFRSLIASIVFILIISSNYPPSDKNKLKGTASGTYTPSVGEAGTRQGVISTNCGTKPLVVFDSDPTQTPIICHQDDGIEAGRVIVTQVRSALFCPNGRHSCRNAERELTGDSNHLYDDRIALYDY